MSAGDNSRGYLDRSRLALPKRDVVARLGDFSEVYAEGTPTQLTAHAQAQGGRCMDCGVPFCQQGCPLGNPIPDFNTLVSEGRWESAFRRLRAINNFPEFTGRLCPAPCEAACVLNVNDDPVTIEDIEKMLSDRAWAQGWVRPNPPRIRSGKRVAIVGSGPAGLAAADQLNLAGHTVTVYERDDKVGGLLRYGIPDFKMEREVLERRVAVMRREGIVFETSVDVGHAITYNTLRADNDALIIALGSRRPRDLNVPGRDLAGVHFAMPFLEAQNRAVADAEQVVAANLSAKGKHVIILGGGDTGSDCLGTALRQGAASVTQVELLQRPPAARGTANPWPQWPVLFRVSSSQAEGGERVFGLLTTSLTGTDGRLEQLVAQPVDSTFQPAGTPVEMPCGMLLLAMGYVGPDAALLTEQLGVGLDARGNIVTSATFETTVPGVFAAGDAQRGQSLVVWAISDGREAARHCDASIRRGSSVLPTRGVDRPIP